MIKPLWGDWLWCHYESISITRKVMLFLGMLNICSLFHVNTTRPWRSLQRLINKTPSSVFTVDINAKRVFSQKVKGLFLTPLYNSYNVWGLGLGFPLRRAARFLSSQEPLPQGPTRGPRHLRNRVLSLKRQQIEKQIANTSVFTRACCSLY